MSRRAEAAYNACECIRNSENEFRVRHPMPGMANIIGTHQTALGSFCASQMKAAEELNLANYHVGPMSPANGGCEVL